MKRIFAFVLLLVSMSGFACNSAGPTTDPNFCTAFKSSTYCYCHIKSMPDSLCGNMKNVYRAMLGAGQGTQEGGCNKQKDTDFNTCMLNWDCYFKGTSKYGACYKQCEKL